MGESVALRAAICGSKRPTAALMRDPPRHREHWRRFKLQVTYVAAYPKFKLERSHSYRIASNGSAFIACRAGTTIAVVATAATIIPAMHILLARTNTFSCRKSRLAKVPSKWNMSTMNSTKPDQIGIKY
jgi:hypothetical protein